VAAAIRRVQASSFLILPPRRGSIARANLPPPPEAAVAALFPQLVMCMRVHRGVTVEEVAAFPRRSARRSSKRNPGFQPLHLPSAAPLLGSLSKGARQQHLAVGRHLQVQGIADQGFLRLPKRRRPT